MPGSITGGTPGTARWGQGDAFVVEADEYAGNFDAYHPELAVLTSAEWDHPDVFADEDAVVTAFEAWLRRAPEGATIVANVGDPGVEAVLRRLRDWPGSIVAYALVDQAPQRLGGYARAIGERFATVNGPATTLLGRITGSDPRSTTLDVYGLDPLAGPITTRLSTAGRHNAANALAVAGTAAALAIAPEAIAAGLATFEGIGRRLERKGDAAGVVVYDDYGHHPTAIRETLAAVRQSR
jgi:UDP-N-acetylmuramate-alanine ligase